MRIVIKGGQWRNTEDEILKAAISKYGKNQWARISSLLVRKTPKQCKARWYEWLDPSIKKTEWTKEEDEKLLHLAKLMPTQWRTIAPIVGRTANQCLERYQRLLDDAEQREIAEAEGGDLGLTGTGEAGPSADDVRRLRPGETDPDPETKPARPDPVDMDEDEKEMLSEARARLANTQGKKAKRKARERQLEEARRLAMLQKKRELKAAGIIMRPKPKKGQMDYNADIPFEKKAAPGFYDTTNEKNRATNAPLGKTLRQLDTPSKRSREEDEQRERQKKARENKGKDAAAAHFVPAKDGAIERRREEESIARRRKLVLPDAQVGETELEDIVKIGQAGEQARGLVDDGDDASASKGLLGEYSALQHAQAARTPRTPASADNIMAEARNLRNMTMTQTPLMGDANTPIHELVGRTAASGFEGATPRPGSGVSATPNPLAGQTPLRSKRDVGATPRGEGPGATPMRTPMRDNLKINLEDATPYGPGETPREVKMRQQDAKRRLQQGFLSLPAPRNEFEPVIPDEEQERIVEVVEAAVEGVEDAAERDEKIKRVREEEERKALERRSQVIKRGLPRPVEFDARQLLADLSDEATGEVELDRLVAQEMVQLIESDSILYPVHGGRQPGGRRSALPQIPDDDLAAARALVHQEMATAAGFPGASEAALRNVVGADPEEFEAAWKEATGGYAFSAELRRYVPAKELTAAQKKAGLEALLEDHRVAMVRDANAAAKLEKRLGKTLGGYQARSKTLADKLVEAVEALNRSGVELASFGRLEEEEQAAVGRRVESLREEVGRLERREREGQMVYRELSEQKRAYIDSIEEMQAEITMREAEAANEAALAAMEDEA